MSKAEELLSRLLAADRFIRAELLEKAEQDFGPGFAASLRRQLESHDLIVANDAAAAAASRSNRSAKAARTRARRRGA